MNSSIKHLSRNIQTVLNYQHGELDLTLVDGCRHDSPLQTEDLPVGSLRLADTAYFRVVTFEKLNETGVFWVSRIPGRVGVFEDGQSTKIGNWLATQQADCIDLPVELTAQRFPCRLIAIGVPDEVAQQRQQRAYAARRSYPVTQTTLELCRWTVMATNLSGEVLSAHQALTLLRLRWQIELLFKLWKQTFSLDEWRTHQPYQILCELYAKLLMLVIQHWCLVVACWHIPRPVNFRGLFDYQLL